MRRLNIVGILLLAVLAAYVAAYSIRNEQETQFRVLFQDRQQESEHFFDAVWEILGRQPETLSLDFTFWDDMVAFVQGKSAPDWGSVNLDPELDTYGVNGAWVYRLDGTLVYGVLREEDGSVTHAPLLPAEKVIATFSHRRLAHFYLNTPRGVIEVRGATIHPTADPNRKTSPQGFFLVGRYLGSDFIAELSRITNSVVAVEISNRSGQGPITDEAAGRYTFFRPLQDQNDVLIGILSVQNTYDIVRVIKANIAEQFGLSFGLIVLVLLSLVGLIIILVRGREQAQLLAKSLASDIENRKKAEATLQARTDELEKILRLTTDRELEMVKLKEKFQKLKEGPDVPNS